MTNVRRLWFRTDSVDRFFLVAGLWLGLVGLSFASGCSSSNQTAGTMIVQGSGGQPPLAGSSGQSGGSVGVSNPQGNAGGSSGNAGLSSGSSTGGFSGSAGGSSGGAGGSSGSAGGSSGSTGGSSGNAGSQPTSDAGNGAPPD